MSKLFGLLTRKMKGAARDEEGSISALSLQLLVIAMVLGGLAVDVESAFQMQTQLQITADSAAHAALYRRNAFSDSVADSKAAAVALSKKMMPVSLYGTVLQESDIQFGSYDTAKRLFTVDSTKTGAVFVATKRYKAGKNALSTLFLRLVGLPMWEIQSDSVFVTYANSCGLQGISSQDALDMQSNSLVHAGFCFSSNTSVKISSNNTFESGAIVQMPDTSTDLILPASGFTTNPGLQAALTNGTTPVGIVSKIGDILSTDTSAKTGAVFSTSPWFPKWYTNEISKGIISYPGLKTVTVTNGYKIGKNDIKKGDVLYFNCKNNGAPTLSLDWISGPGNSKTKLDLTDVILVTDCALKIGDGVTLQNTFLGTKSTSDHSVTDTAAATFGLNDGCNPYNGVQIVTAGGVAFTSANSFYGTQIIAAGDVSITANAGSIGLSVIAGGKASVTSNGDWNSCPDSGTVDYLTVKYFHLAA